MQPPSSRGVDRPATVVAAIALSMVGPAAFLVLPMIIGGAAVSFALDQRQVGLLATGAMAGSAVSATLAIFWVRRIDWRYCAVAALCLLAAGHLGAVLADGFRDLVAAMFISSLGGGAVYSLALTVLSDHRTPERVFGYSVATQVSFQVLGFLMLPAVIRWGGLSAVFSLFCGLAVGAALLVPLLPPRGRAPGVSSIADAVAQPGVVMALMGCLLFFFNVGCVWAYIERIADAAGLSAATIGNALALGVAAGILGSLTASWLGGRCRFLLPLTISAVGTVIAVALLTTHMSLLVFVASALLYNFVWNLSLPYQYALIADADGTGRCVAVAPAFHAVGAAIGPGVAAPLVQQVGFGAVQMLAAASVMVSLLLFVPAARRHGAVAKAV